MACFPVTSKEAIVAPANRRADEQAGNLAGDQIEVEEAAISSQES
jgi:hypothetical protein